MSSTAEDEARALVLEWRNNPQSITHSIDALESLTIDAISDDLSGETAISRLREFEGVMQIAAKVMHSNGLGIPVGDADLSIAHGISLGKFFGHPHDVARIRRRFSIMRQSVLFWLDQNHSSPQTPEVVKKPIVEFNPEVAGVLKAAGIKAKSLAEKELGFIYVDSGNVGVVESEKASATLTNRENAAFRVLVKSYPGEVTTKNMADRLRDACESSPPQAIKYLKLRLDDVGLTIKRAPYRIERKKSEMSPDDIGNAIR